MKNEWPEKDKVAYFEDLTKPIVKAIKFAYSIRRKNKDKDVPWTGPGVGASERACCPPPKEMLSAENLKYSMDDQGRNALEEIVGVAIRLGIEQGRRIFLESSEYRLLQLKADGFDRLYKDKNDH